MRSVRLDESDTVQLMAVQEAVYDMNERMLNDLKDPVLLESKDGSLVKPRFGGQELVPLSAEGLSVVVRSNLEPLKDVKGIPVPQASLPTPIIKAYLNIKDWRGVPLVRQVTRAPIIRPDWTVRWESGYDESTQCWVLPGVEEDHRLDGLDLRTVFAQFALADPRYVTDLLAAALTPYMTTAVDAAYPGLLVTASKPGSGKTYLAQTVGTLGNCGFLPDVTAWKGPDAMGNVITSSVKSERQLVIFDNVKGDIDSPELEAVITSRGISDRRFHTQDIMTLRSNTVWFMTANGASVSPDMIRRCIVVNLDKEKNPVGWNGALLPWTRDYEAALVTRMVGLVEAWAAAGAVPGDLMHPGFERWSVAVSGVLEYGGFRGLWECRDDVLASAVSTDEDDEADVLDRLGRVMGVTDGWTATQLWDVVNDPATVLFMEPDRQFLKRWLEECSRGRNRSMAVGWALSKLSGRTVTGAVVRLEKSSRKYFCSVVSTLTL